MKRTRSKRWWTIGRLMILVAALAVPLALYMQHVRVVQRRQALVRKLDFAIQAALNSQLKSQAVKTSVEERPR